MYKKINRPFRYDFFIVWGNGLQHAEKILSILRSEKDLEIIRIESLKVRNMKKFVFELYAGDTVPIEHLRTKLKYLFSVKPELLIIFVKNCNPKEMPAGQGLFRKVQCQYINQIKIRIRNQFNPRHPDKDFQILPLDKGILHEHVIHASDYEQQVGYLLKILGHKNGIEFLRNVPNPILSLPYYLPKFEEFTIQRVSSSQVYCNILRGTRESFWKEAVEIEKTPHFACLTGKTIPYKKYLAKFLGGPLTGDYSVENLMKLSQNLAYLEPPYTAAYILVKELEPKKYLIVDGVHRASVLKFKGVNSFPVAMIK